MNTKNPAFEPLIISSAAFCFDFMVFLAALLQSGFDKRPLIALGVLVFFQFCITFYMWYGYRGHEKYIEMSSKPNVIVEPPPGNV